MNWMWIIIGVLAGLFFMTKRNGNNRIEAGGNRDREETETYTPVVRSMTGTGDLREVREAIAAGERALDSLRTAKDRLNSARAWGVYDILGGGLISSMIKHGKIDDANEWVQQANHDLRRFSKELRDVTGEGEYIRTGDMVSVLDMFCDNFLTDIMVQSRINGAREQIDSIIGRVQETVRELERKAAGC